MEYVQEGEFQTQVLDEEEEDNNSLLVSGFISKAPLIINMVSSKQKLTSKY